MPIGAFLAFTLSQVGMAMHWKRQGGEDSIRRMTINGVGAFATGVTLLLVLVGKFREGAWITAILIPASIITMSAVKRHYSLVRKEVAIDRPMRIDNLTQPLVIVPLDRCTRVTEKGRSRWFPPLWLHNTSSSQQFCTPPRRPELDAFAEDFVLRCVGRANSHKS